MHRIVGYSIISKLHENDVIVVYRAIRESDDRPVVIKLLRGAYPGDRSIALFRHAYDIASKLDVEGVLRMFDLTKYQNSLMIVMEDIGGASLDKAAPDPKPDWVDIFHVGTCVAETLGHIHQRRIVHKDINPANIIWNPKSRRVGIIDFASASELLLETREATEPGRMQGTLAYMSPEQTGRMNRAVDYRTDLYSLGATLYTLATGAPPFQSGDPLEMVHCHIARPVPPPSSHNSSIPGPLSDIIMKLLAKNAEERYQSAFGLKADLQRCLDELKKTGKIEPFEIGGSDISDQFRLPQILYGRKTETDTLHQAFERVCAGESEFFAVFGAPGVGKSAVVNEMQRLVVAYRGFFISGKFDQLGRDIPYGALIRAFRQLINLLLAEEEDQLEQWKDRVLAAVGVNGGLLVDVLPELAVLIGSQSEVQPLAPAEAQNRFQVVFRNFVSVFAQAAHPLVIFVDDLQWADAASLNLLEQLLSGTDLQYLLVVGTYRDNEVFPAHPVMLTLDAIRKGASAAVHSLQIKPLAAEDICRLVADVVLSDTDPVRALAEAVYLRTRGNPFFTVQYLQSLYTAGLIYFDAVGGKWCWEIEKIDLSAIPPDVVALMADKICDLPESAVESLKLAACIGNRFDLETLAVICQQTAVKTASELWPALREGLIVPVGDAYQLMLRKQDASTAEMDVKDLSGEIVYRFLHDRVQQAAYSLIPEDLRKRTHLRIGRLLRDATEGEQVESKTFDIVNHLNFALDLMQDADEKRMLARLNLTAGKRAEAAAAYTSALNYFSTAAQLLPDVSWSQSYAFMLELYTEGAKCAYLCARFPEMSEWVRKGLDNTRRFHDAVPFYEIRMQYYFALTKPMDAIREGLSVLTKLGCRFPARPGDIHALMGILKIKWQMRGKSIDDLHHVADMDNPEVASIFRILPHLGSSAYRAYPKLLPLVVLKGVQLFLRYGNAAEASFFVASYAFVLCGALGKVDIGYRFGELALALKERPVSRRFKARTWFVFEGFVRHWKKPLRQTLEPFLAIYRQGLEVGDVEFGTTALHLHSSYSYLAGKPLGELASEMADYSRAIAQFKQGTNLNYQEVFRQAVANLHGRPADPIKLSGGIYDEARMIPIHIDAKDSTALYVLYLNKLIIACHFGEFAQAMDFAREMETHKDSTLGLFYWPVGYYYEAVARLALAKEASQEKQKSHLRRARRILKKMKQWADASPGNHLHRVLLINAELEWGSGHFLKAANTFEEALQVARRNEFYQDEAFTFERFAMFWTAHHKPDVAHIYLQKAFLAYKNWEANAKLAHMAGKYPNALAPVLRESPPAQGGAAGLPATSLDITSVVKASQAISSEIAHGKMLANLMRIVLENAGAQKGVLILSKAGQFHVEAEGTVDKIDILDAEPLFGNDPAGNRRAPELIVRYVARTNSPLLIDHAAADRRFDRDAYIRQNNVKSVLCLPILRHGELIGILYLENNLAYGVFTPERFELLKLLSSQAAISIENASLYATLEEKIIARTQALEEARDKIVRLEKEATEIQMAGGFAHEMRNALAGAQKLLDKAFDAGNEAMQSLCYSNAIRLNRIFDLLQDTLPVGEMREISSLIGEINDNEDTLDEILRRARKRIRRALGIVDEIMEYSRIGQSRPGDRAVFLPDIINAIVKEEAADEFIEDDVQIHVEMHAQKMLKGDERHFFSILMNLLLNARDAVLQERAPGERYIEIKVQETDVAQIVSIADNGAGISPENKNRIFDPFFSTKPHTGTGLGLGVTLKLVSLYNGKIEVASKIGEGTVFTISFPFQA